jgi:hypothetical protein
MVGGSRKEYLNAKKVSTAGKALYIGPNVTLESLSANHVYVLSTRYRHEMLVFR